MKNLEDLGYYGQGARRGSLASFDEEAAKTKETYRTVVNLYAGRKNAFRRHKRYVTNSDRETW
jgi:hypothetical protein